MQEAQILISGNKHTKYSAFSWSSGYVILGYG